MLTFFRVDERLVHGQTVEGWAPALGIEAITIISDELVSDSLRRRLVEFAIPSGIKLCIVSVEEAPKVLCKAQKDNVKTMALMPGLSEALSLVRAGVHIPSLNVGGEVYTSCLNIAKGSLLSSKDKECIKELAAAGVCAEGRGVPSDTSLDLLVALGDK